MVTSIDALADALVDHLLGLPALPGVIAVGEPTHTEPVFLAYWQRVLDRLIEHGVRSVVLETDAVAALNLDAWVRGGSGTLNDVLATGLTHGFGQRLGMRELIARLRVHNDERPPAERVSVHGFDLPTEMIGAPSPRRELEHLHGYLAATLDPARLPVDAGTLDALLGDDGPWGTWEAQLDAAHSVGGSPEAVRLRAVADDLVAVLHTEAPRLVAATSLDDWRRALLHGRSALALLRYHAIAARPASKSDRLSSLMGARDEGMARHLRAIRDVERRRGATLVLAHDGHLQRVRSTWRLDHAPLGWCSAGAIAATVGEDTYHHIASVLAASSALGLGAPPQRSLEATLTARAHHGLVTSPETLADLGDRPVRDDVAPEHGYLPLDATALADADAVAILGDAAASPADDPTVADLAVELLARPGVTHLRADAASGAPEVAHGDWFFYADPDDRMPYATIVVSDYPGFDEASRLDRPGVFRLNLGVGRSEVERLAAEVDPSALDRVLAHPIYAAQGWVAILNPSIASLGEITRLADAALARARRR